jgi:hypothetical protein
MTIASLVILTSSPHIWNEVSTTGVSDEKWKEMTMNAVGIEDEDEQDIAPNGMEE